MTVEWNYGRRVWFARVGKWFLSVGESGRWEIHHPLGINRQGIAATTEEAKADAERKLAAMLAELSIDAQRQEKTK